MVFWGCKRLYIYHIIILSCYHITIWSYDHSYHNIIWEKKQTCSGQTSGSVLCVYIYISNRFTIICTIILLHSPILQLYIILILLYFYTITLSCHLMLTDYFAIMLVYYCTVLLLCYFTVLLLYYRTIIITCVCYYYTSSLPFTIIILYDTVVTIICFYYCAIKVLLYV